MKLRPFSLMLGILIPATASAWDLDLDGEGPESDVHPCAADRSGRLFLPARDEFGTLLLESDGDEDFNDAVVGYRFIADVNKDLQVAAVSLRAVPRALGDASDVGLGWWLRVGTATTVEVTIEIDGHTEMQLAMTSTTVININVFSSLRDGLGGGAGPIRTRASSTIEEAGLLGRNVNVSFSQPVRVDFEQMHEGLHIRELGGPVAAGSQMKTPSGLPRLLMLPKTTGYPREGVSVFDAWPRLATLVRTGSSDDLDFYLGPHDPAKIWGDDDPAAFEDEPVIDLSCVPPCEAANPECNAAFAARLLEECAPLVDSAFAEDALDAPPAESNTFTVPSLDQLEDLPMALEAFAQGAALPAAKLADLAGYRMCRSASADVVVFVPYSKDEGRAVFAWRVQGARPVLVGAPHPHYETNTREEARRLFGELGLRLLIVSGTHRCASHSEVDCSGTTGVCGDATSLFRISDMAHTTDSIYQMVHNSFADLFPFDVHISLHGMGDDGVSISNGSAEPLVPDGTAARLARALTETLRHERITVCQDSPEFTVEQRLCGLTNVQGRALNGSADACLAGAPENSKRFVHVEQSLAVRQRLDLVVHAFDQALPN